MASYYDKELLCLHEHHVEEAAFCQSRVLEEKAIGILRHRAVKIAVCLAGILILALLLPRYSATYQTAGFPIVLMVALAALTGYLLFFQSRFLMEDAAERYTSNHLLQEPEEIRLTRDGFEIQNQYETITGYWAEKEHCIETTEFFLMLGGRERPVLILSKKGLGEEERRWLSEQFRNIFAARYQAR